MLPRMSTLTRFLRPWRRHTTVAQFLATCILLAFTFAFGDTVDATSAVGGADAASAHAGSRNPVQPGLHPRAAVRPDSARLPAAGPISTTVTTQPRGQLSLIGQVGGRLTAVALTPDGRTACIGEGQRLTTWAINRSASASTIGARPPTQLASSALLGDVISDIALLPVDGRLLAAVTVRTAGLFIFDLTDPAQPLALGHLASRGSAGAVALGQRPANRGLGWLYISVAASNSAGQGLWVVDASDPQAPVDLGIRQQWSIPMDDLAVAGDQLIVVYSYNGYDGGLLSYDVSDPLAPRALGGHDRDYSFQYAYSVALAPAGDGRLYAYTADLVVDVTPGSGDPIVHQFPELPDADGHWSIDRVGGTVRAYTIHRGHLMAFDISTPRVPIGVGAYPLDCCEWVGGLSVAAGIAVVAEPEGLVQAFDVGHLNTIRLVRLDRSDYYRKTNEIELAGNYALVLHKLPGDGSAYLTIFDMTNPAEPRQVSRTNAAAERLSVSGTHAFLVDEWTLGMLDITDPTAPRASFSLYNGPFPGQYYLEPRDATALGRIMYVASVHGLAIYDLEQTRTQVSASPEVTRNLVPPPFDSVTTAPTALATVVTPDEARAVKVRVAATGDRVILYLAEGPRLRTYDVTDPNAPSALGVITLAGRINDLDVVDDLVYAAVDLYGLQIVAVRQPAAPALLSTTRFTTPLFDWRRGSPCRVRVDTRRSSDGRRLAYLVTDALIIIDVTDPAAPSLLAGFPPDFRVHDAEAAWPWVFHGDWWGLRISRIADPPTPPTPLGNARTLGRVETLAAAAGAPGLVYTDVMGGPLTALDLTDPALPRSLGQRTAAGNTIIDVARHGHLYLWEQGNNGWWYDATDPTAIRPGSVFVTSAYYISLLESGDRAWLLAFTGSPSYPRDSLWNGLRLFDITNGRPVPLGEYRSGIDALPCVTQPAVVPAANGDPILHATLPEGVFAFNLNATEPLGNPVKVFANAAWLAADGRYLYRGLADGWEVYDASSLIATHHTPFAPSPLQFSDGRAWTSDATTLHVLDLRDLAHPVEIAAAALPPSSGTRWGFPAIAGSRAYCAGGDYGVWFLEYRPPRTWLPLIRAGNPEAGGHAQP